MTIKNRFFLCWTRQALVGNGLRLILKIGPLEIYTITRRARA